MTDNYKSWNSQQLVEWITQIDTSFEEKYRETLITVFTEKQITGINIDTLDLTDLKIYGIIN